MTGDHLFDYLQETNEIIRRILEEPIHFLSLRSIIAELASLRDRGGRLFIIGNGGSAANASHAVNDFRKIAGIEAYCPTDNVAELTARINDDGWNNSLAAWLAVSNCAEKDLLLVLSVGGGDIVDGTSVNLVWAINYAREQRTKVIGIVGRDGGYTAVRSDVCLIIPTVNEDRITPHVEEMQSIILHLLVSHPRLRGEK